MYQHNRSHVAPPKTKLLDLVRQSIRSRHYSLRNEQAYVQWIRRLIFINDKRHPKDMGAEEVQAFLNHLSTNRRVAASTQNRALCALVFLYRDVLKQKFGDLKEVKWVKRPQRLPVVFKREEIGAIFSFLKGVKWIMATLLYGSGLRVMECVRLRVKDIDFAYNQIIVRDGKGHKERVTILPDNLKAPLKAHLENVRRLHQKDISEGFGRVYLP